MKKRNFVLVCILMIAAMACIGLEWWFALAKNNHATLTFIGHASVKLKTSSGVVIYIDPYYPVDCYREPADYILLTHSHPDHNAPGLCNKKENCRIIRYGDALIDGEYQTFDFQDVTIEAVPSGENASHSVKCCVGYLVKVDQATVYHAGDTSFGDGAKEIAKKKIDYAMYPVDGKYDMGPEEASQMADFIGASINIPIHGDGDHYYLQRYEFHAKGTRVLHLGETILLKKQE